MFSKKDFILSNVNIKEVLNRYGIKMNRDMFCCPFHRDDYPSAKSYGTSYFCFGCGKNGDLIQFVQDYFNLDFMSAMEKINIDFNLQIPQNNKISKKELQEIEEKRKLAQQQKQNEEMKKRNTLIFVCELEKRLIKTYKILKDLINPYNWEETVEICSYIEQELALLNEEFESLNIKSDY